MAMFLVLVLSFPKRDIGFSFEVVSTLDISGDLIKKVFMFNIVTSYASILLLHGAEFGYDKKNSCICGVIKMYAF